MPTAISHFESLGGSVSANRVFVTPVTTPASATTASTSAAQRTVIMRHQQPQGHPPLRFGTLSSGLTSTLSTTTAAYPVPPQGGGAGNGATVATHYI